MQHYDAIVIGLGAMGAATLWRLSQAGVRVLGLEAGGPVHTNGSSHGATRIFRRAYFEGPAYLPLLNLSHAGWQELQAATQRQLIYPTGAVFIGPKHTGLVEGSLRTARAGNVEHSQWDAKQLRNQLPQLNIEDTMHAVFEPRAYALASDTARLQMLDQAVRHGAELRYGAGATDIACSSAGLTITSRDSKELHCKTAVVTTGAWLSCQLLTELACYLRPQHVPVYWFTPRPGSEASFAADVLPVFVYECSDGALLYGIPIGTGERSVKIGFHNRQQLPWSDDGKPQLTDAMRREIGSYVARIFPNLLPQPSAGTWCIYTLSPDGSFLLGESQRLPGVYYASVCSGHGFKFATGIGSVMAALVKGEPPPVAIDAFSVSRFATARIA